MHESDQDDEKDDDQLEQEDDEPEEKDGASEEEDGSSEEEDGKSAAEDGMSAEVGQQAVGERQLSDEVGNFYEIEAVTAAIKDGTFSTYDRAVRVSVSDINQARRKWVQIRGDEVEQFKIIINSTEIPEREKVDRLPTIEMRIIEGSGVLAVVSGFETAAAVYEVYGQTSKGWSVLIKEGEISESDAIIAVFRRHLQGRQPGNVDLLLFLDTLCDAIRPGVVAKHRKAGAEKVARKTLCKLAEVLEEKQIAFNDDLQKKIFAGRRCGELGTLGKLILDPTPTAPLRRFMQHIFAQDQKRQVRISLCRAVWLCLARRRGMRE